MTVRFKSEYQKSFPVPRPRRGSLHRSLPSAGLRSDHMGASREPSLQRRRRLVGPGGSCRTLLAPPDPGHTQAPEIAPSRDLKGRSVHRKDPNPAMPSRGPSVPETPPGPRSTAEPEKETLVGLKAKPELGHHSVVEPQPASQPAAEPAEKSANMYNTMSAHPTDGQQPSANQALRWKAGLTSGGHRSGGHTSEYHQQFSTKKLRAAASPILTADQMLHSSSRAVPPFKNGPVPMETEYRQSYKDHDPPAKPRLRKHLEAQRVPLFHMHMGKKKREGSQKKSRLHKNVPSQPRDKATPPTQVQRPHRKSTEYQSSFRSPLYRILEEGGATDADSSQVVALRRQARSYRRRAWGVNFCRDHLNQLQSEHTVLWEPAETTASDPSTPPPITDRHHGSASVEALHLPLRSRTSSASNGTNREAPTDAAAEACEEEDTDEEEGRLPTPRLKMLPVQRTHHDLTTPATGGAILVGKLKHNGDAPAKQGCVSVISVAKEAGPVVNTPVTCKEAWPEVDATHLTPHVASPIHHNAAKMTKVKPQSPEPLPGLAPPPPLLAPPPHCIHGSLRSADFQHNGALGLRSREPICSGGGCGTDPDDRLSVMSWRSAASCSEASAVLERAQKRRDDFWGREDQNLPAE